MSLKVEAEVNIDSEPCLLAWEDTLLFVGTEDGSIKSYDSNLTPGASWSAHAVQLFALTACAGKVYSSSNDGGVRIWTTQGQKIAELPASDGDIGVLRIHNNLLYTGDELGTINVYANNVLKAKYTVLEEVKDMIITTPYMFTTRDLYVSVTEIKPEESKYQFITRHVMEGRSPLRITGKYLLTMARGGNSLQLHDASVNTEFKQLHEVKVSDMIVTSMAVTGDYVWTGGWDTHVKRWKIANDKLEAAGDITLGACINALVADGDSVYAAVSGGKIVKIKY